MKRAVIAVLSVGLMLLAGAAARASAPTVLD